jgi:hypothetical protein
MLGDLELYHEITHPEGFINMLFFVPYCLLKNMSTKHSKYVVNKKLKKHVIDISFRELFGRPFFIMKYSWTNSLKNEI